MTSWTQRGNDHRLTRAASTDGGGVGSAIGWPRRRPSFRGRRCGRAADLESLRLTVAVYGLRPPGRRRRRSCSSATSSAAIGRRVLRAAAPGSARAHAPRLRRRQRRERRRRPRHHPARRRRAVRAGRRRDHARQPHLPPPRDLQLPRRARRDPPAGELPAQPAGPRHLRRRARRRSARRREPLAATSSCGPGARRSPRPTLALRELARRVDHVLVDMHAEATSEKVAHGLAPRRPRDRGRRHPHARADGRRARAAGRHRLHHRRRYDRRRAAA